jgi:hypothetical protein
MKNILVLALILLLNFSLFGQENDSLQIKGKSTPTLFNKDPLMIFDNVVITQKDLIDIDPKLIQEVEIIKEGKSCEIFVESYGVVARNGVIIIRTKKYIALQWLNIFNKFCKSDKLSELLTNPSFDYKITRVFLNGKKLKLDFFDKFTLDESEIAVVHFRKAMLNKDKYKISIKTK